MSTRHLSFLAIAVCLHVPATVAAQGTQADYERAGRLPELCRDRVFRTRVDARWDESGDRFWYRNDLPGGAREFIRVDAVAATREPAFDHAAVARALAGATGQPVEERAVPIDWLELGSDGKTIRFNALGKGWRLDLESHALSEADLLEPPRREERGRRRGRRGRPRGSRGGPREVTSPDGRRVAFIKDHNVHVRDAEGGESFALSDEGTAEDGYGSRISWSPDSTKLVAMRTAEAQEHTVYMIESSPTDQVQPKLHSRQYLKPGDRIANSKPHLFDVDARKEIPIDDALFPNPWRIDEVRWHPDSRRFTFVYNQRGHQVLRIVAVDAGTGEAGAIIDERSDTFIDYAHKRFTHYVDATHEIIWMSERDGWNHLYLHDSRTGSVKNQITRGTWVVRRVDRVDDEKRQIWFRAGGIYPGQDPYYVHFCRIDFDGSNLVILTDGNGTHDIEPSPDGRYLIDTYSRVDMPPVTELRRASDGALVLELERADWSALLETGWRAPERFAAKGRDGATDIYGIIFHPTNFDAARKYPVIEKIYAGPQGSHVPKRFRPYYRAQSLAELGFIVVQIDGMGTSNRSKAFHDVCWRNLRDAGFPDRMAWMRAAAELRPYMDLTRVGVYGGSAGGQNALGALLFHPEFYKVAVADCGCHDNRMDKIWWNELWMGWPVGEEYAENSNVTHAHRLQGKLLLTVGELDTNVDPSSTLQVVNALIKAEKDFEFLLVPGAGHGVGDGSPYMVRRRRDFFVRHLYQVEPRREVVSN